MLYYIFNTITYYIWYKEEIPNYVQMKKELDKIYINKEIVKHETFVDEIRERHKQVNYGLRKTDIVLE